MSLPQGSVPIAGGSALAVDPSSRRPLRARLTERRTLVLAGVGAGAYLLALLASFPATMVVERSDSVIARAGTVWNGEVALAGGDRLAWKWAPLRSLASLGFAVDWQLTGPVSDLAGRAVARPGGVTLDTVSGRAGGSLIEAVAPYLPFRCQTAMQVAIDRAGFGDGISMIDGEARSDAGSCSLKSGAGAASSVPPLIVAAHPLGADTVLTIAPIANRTRQLVTATIGREGHMVLKVTPEGARVLPFAAPPGSAGVTVETDL